MANPSDRSSVHASRHERSHGLTDCQTLRADEDSHPHGGTEAVPLVEARRIAVTRGEEVPVPHVLKVFAKALQEAGAVSLTLCTGPNAHLLEEEVVVGSRAFQVPEGEADRLTVRVERADTVGTRRGEEVAEPLRGVRGSPRFVPRRSVESVDIERDTRVERLAR